MQRRSSRALGGPKPTGAIHRATLTKKHCAGDFEGAAREFGRWTRAGGRVMRGLIRRREAEAELYRRGG